MKLICGPMATVSHPAFRILVEQFGGCDEYYTEMINAGTLITGGPFEKYYIDPSPVPEKVVWQLTGHNIDNMLIAAEQLVQLPGIGLDLNMGCSAPDIYKTGAGIAWMLKDRSETERLVKEIRKIVPSTKRLSVKFRLGDERFKDDEFFSFVDMLVNNGVELLTLHPRTKKEKLTRPPRYSYCEEVAKRTGLPVYVNGNVNDKASFEYVQKVCPSCAGVMISRASIQQPWIFARLKGLPVENVNMLNLAFSYIDNVRLYQPPEFWKTRLQRFFTYYSQNFLFAHYAQTQFLNAKDIDDLKDRLRKYFEQCPGDKILFEKKNF